MAPKPVPVIVIEALTGPELADNEVICGVTVNVTPLLDTPPTVTTTFPVVAGAGTFTVMFFPEAPHAT